MRSIIRNAAAAVCLMVGTSSAVWAAPPDAVAGLVGVKGRDGESELLARGYILHHASEAKDAKMTVWWNATTKSCLEVLTRDGRYAEINAARQKQCEGEPR
jgi:hypothetical protein